MEQLRQVKTPGALCVSEYSISWSAQLHDFGSENGASLLDLIYVGGGCFISSLRP